MNNKALNYYIALGLKSIDEVTLFLSLRNIYSTAEALQLIKITR